MKKKNTQKLILDILMFIVLVILFKKNALGMAFHEIAGLSLLAVFIFHKIINRKWIVSVSGRLFQKNLAPKVRFQFIIDCLMLICFILIGLSGAMISKVVFSFHNNAMIWKVLHYFCAALVLVLSGIHIGLHMPFFASVFCGNGKMKPVLRVGLIVLTTAISAYGIFNLIDSSFTRWISMPFSISQAAGDHGPMPEQSGSLPQNAEEGEEAAESSHGPGQGKGQGQGNRDGQGGGQGREQSGVSITTALSTFAQFGSIVILFAALTALSESLFKRKSRTAESN